LTEHLKKISFTIDLEWWGRAHLLQGKVPYHKGLIDDINALEDLLIMLEDLKIKATFFIVTNDIKCELVKKISASGHEIASHCVDHSYYKSISPQKWKSNIFDSKKYLEDACNSNVYGFRTPSWSIEFDKASFHLSVLHDAGYVYDSSFSSYETKLYGDKRFNKTPYLTDEGIVEFPLPVIGAPNAPWVGGTFLRVAPRCFSQYFIKKECPSFLYIHPWELYENKETLPRISISDALITTYGRKNFKRKVFNLINALQDDFQFITLYEQAKTIKALSLK
jgi:peptidoglycan-N-acetylglucosamine deacetylase